MRLKFSSRLVMEQIIAAYVEEMTITISDTEIDITANSASLAENTTAIEFDTQSITDYGNNRCDDR